MLGNGLNPTFDKLVHCLAAEPRETILRIGVLDGEAEVAYETAVLSILRPGYRTFAMRSIHGTRVRLCTLLVHIALGDEVNTASSSAELKKVVIAQQALLVKQQQEIEQHLRTVARMTRQNITPDVPPVSCGPSCSEHASAAAPNQLRLPQADVGASPPATAARFLSSRLSQMASALASGILVSTNDEDSKQYAPLTAQE
jgi:hypothetical protein